MHKIAPPPFYAASVGIRVQDSYGGLRINGKAQVLDTHGRGHPGPVRPAAVVRSMA